MADGDRMRFTSVNISLTNPLLETDLDMLFAGNNEIIVGKEESLFAE